MVLVRPITAGLVSRGTKTSVTRGHEIAPEMKFVYGKKLYHKDRTVVPKHVVVDTYNELCCMTCVLLYFTKCILCLLERASS